MERLSAILLFAAVSLFPCALAQTPVPARQQGYLLQGNCDSSVLVEVFYDHLCIDSAPNWPVFKQAVKAFSEDDLAVLIHFFPLPYHHNTYFMTQAGHVVRSFNSELFVPFMEAVFKDIDKFSTDAVNMTEPQVQEMIADYVESNFQVPKSMVLIGFSDPAVRAGWKSAASRAITGTPQFIVNGIHLPDAPDYSSEQWKTFINSLINAKDT